MHIPLYISPLFSYYYNIIILVSERAKAIALLFLPNPINRALLLFRLLSRSSCSIERSTKRMVEVIQYTPAVESIPLTLMKKKKKRNLPGTPGNTHHYLPL